MIRDFAAGFFYLLRGFRLLGEPGLRAYVIVPLAINVVVFVLLIWLGAAEFSHLVHHYFPHGHQWLTDIIMVIAVIFYGVVVLVVVFFSFTAVANLIGAPFNGFLAEKVERRLANDTQAPPRSSHLLADFLPAILGQLSQLLYYSLFAVLLLVLTIAGLFLFTAPLSLIVGAWLMAVEYLTYPMANHNLEFSEVRRWMRGHRMLGLGFGFGVTLASMIPLVNFLVMPAAVAGATALWVERGDRGSAHE